AGAAMPSPAYPRATAAVCLLETLLLMTLSLAWVTSLPVRVPAIAVIIARPDIDSGEPSVVAAALLPADTLAQLEAGQAMYLQLGSEGDRVRRIISLVEPRTF